MNRRGQVYKLEYVGNNVIKKLAGLASIQPMLRDMYALYRKLDGKDRHRQGEIASTVLQTTDEGLYIRFRRKGARADEEVFYPAPAILFYEAVRFVCTVADRKGKKVNSAFDPLEKDQASRQPNVYSQLDKKYHFLLPLSHPALFVCVLRRPRGSKPVTDMHVWRCVDNSEALEMIMLLDHVQALYASNESKRSAVFDYNPRRQTVPPTRALAGGGSSGNLAVQVRQNAANSHSVDNLNNVVHYRADQSPAAHVRSMVDIRRPGYVVDDRPNPNNARPHQRPNQQRQDEDVASWDRPARLSPSSSEAAESYSEMTQWHYQGSRSQNQNHQGQGHSQPGATPAGAGMPKSRSIANAKAGEPPKHLVGQSSSGQQLSRLPRTPLSSTDHDQNQGLTGGHLTRDDSVFIHSRSENDMLRHDAERRRTENNGAVSPPSQGQGARNSNVIVKHKNNKDAGPTFLKQSDFLPISSKPPIDPRSKNNRESAYGAKRGDVATSNAAVPAQNSNGSDFFFFGMTDTKKSTNNNNNVNVSQVLQTSGFVDGGRNSSSSPSMFSNANLENISEDIHRPPHALSAGQLDRASRARQLAVESSFRAQHQYLENQQGPSSSRQEGYDEVPGQDLYPIGPALKMLDIGGGSGMGSDRPVARILPHKTYGIQVLPSEIPPGSKSPVPPKLSPVGLGLMPGPGSSSGLRRTETEYYSGNGQKNGSNNAKQLPSVASNSKNNYGYGSSYSDDEEGSNYVNMQKKTAEIAAILDDIEVDNLRHAVKPIGHVNLERSLGYFP